MNINAIGATNSTPAAFFNGNIDDPRYYDSEILSGSDLYAGTDPQVEPISHWTLDDGGQNLSLPGPNDPIIIWDSRDLQSKRLSQQVATKRPVYAIDSNGKSWLRFDGVNDLMEYLSSISNSEAGFVFVVYKWINDTGNNQYMVCMTSRADSHHYLGFAVKPDRGMVTAQDTGTTHNRVESAEADLISVLGYGSTGVEYKHYDNNIEQYLTVPDGSNNGDWSGDTDNINTFAVGGLKRDTEMYFANMDIAEIVGYNRPIDRSVVAIVANELMKKYKITT